MNMQHRLIALFDKDIGFDIQLTASSATVLRYTSTVATSHICRNCRSQVKAHVEGASRV